MSPRRKRRSSRKVRSSKAGTSQGRTTKGHPGETGTSRWAELAARPTAAVWTVGALLLLVPLVLDPRMGEAFRPPKLWLAELLALVSLVLLSGRLLTVERVDLRAVMRWPAIQVAVPLTLAVVLSAATSGHPRVAIGTLVSFAIGATALVGWSAGLPRPRLRALLTWLLVPATLLALLGVLQFHGLFRPFGFAGDIERSRLGVTSLAGNPADLGAFLVLPALLAQVELLRRRRAWRWAMAGVLGIVAYGLLVTQTLTAIAALGASSLVLWTLRVPRRRRLPVLAGCLVAGVLVVSVVTPVRERVVSLTRAVTQGELNRVLTGRLDGWRVAVSLLGDHPVTGVGPGAFEASFADAKLELVDAGAAFLPGQAHVMFANAHNEVLEAGAEWGLPGLLGLAWAVLVLIRRLWQVPSADREADGGADGEEKDEIGDRALAWAGCTALALLSLTFFPMRLALVAYPFLVFLAWLWVPSVQPSMPGPSTPGPSTPGPSTSEAEAAP